MDAFAERAGAYIHIPFCGAICPYCDFAVVAGRDGVVDRYLAAVQTEIRADRSWRQLDAVYFGGGTPSRVPAASLGRVIDVVRSAHGIAPDAELTLEANPEDFTSETARTMRGAGFNRVSFGAQSFDSRVLLALGRRHRPDEIVESVANARSAGFENVSVDLIYGTPAESMQSWKESLTQAMSAEPDHVSCYALTVEPGTELWRQVRDGASAPDPDLQVDRFLMADEILPGAGLVRYEVSNWSRPGMECVYNSIVWAQGEYVAYGNGAHRFREGERSGNLRRLDSYLSAVESGSSPVAGSELVDGWEAELDRLFVGLRRVVGVELGIGGQALLQSASGKHLTEAGVIEVVDGRLRIVNPMLTDEVLRAVVDLNPQERVDHLVDADNVWVEVADA